MWIFLLSCTLLVCPVRFRDTGTIMPTGKWSLQFSRVKKTYDSLVTKDWERRRVKHEQESWHATWWGPWKCKLFFLKLRSSVGCWELDGTAQMWPKATGTWPRFLPGLERKEGAGWALEQPRVRKYKKGKNWWSEGYPRPSQKNRLAWTSRTPMENTQS